MLVVTDFSIGCRIVTSTLVLLVSNTFVESTRAAVFTPLGTGGTGNGESQALAISADGLTVVGSATAPSGSAPAFRWDVANGLQFLTGSLPGFELSQSQGVSADGMTIAGTGSYANGPLPHSEAFVWTSAGGATPLGDLPGGVLSSSASGISADGLVIAGNGRSGAASHFEGFVWSAENGMTGLGDLPGGDVESSALGISADGTTVVGSSSSDSGSQAIVWNAPLGIRGIGYLAEDGLPNGPMSVAYGVSSNGSTVVGESRSESGIEAFVWSAENGMQGLGDLPSGGYDSHAFAVSGDGSTVVGRGYSGDYYEAFVWNPQFGMRSIQTLLSAAGIDLTGWQLQDVRGISADGRTVAGWGLNPQGRTEAFVALLPDDVNDDRDGDGVADTSDDCPGDTNANQHDEDGDGLGDVCDPYPQEPCHYAGFLTASTVILSAFENHFCEDWSGAVQWGPDLQSVNLERADLSYSYLPAANFQGSALHGADLTGAVLSAAGLAGVDLSDAILRAADLSDADLSFGTLTGSSYDEWTVFPSGRSYESPPWNLPDDRAPWDAGMIPAPEPGADRSSSSARSASEGSPRSEEPGRRVGIRVRFRSIHRVEARRRDPGRQSPQRPGRTLVSRGNPRSMHPGNPTCRTGLATFSSAICRPLRRVRARGDAVGAGGNRRIMETSRQAIGRILLASEVIDAEQLRYAERVCSKLATPRPLVDVIQELFGVTRERIVEVMRGHREKLRLGDLLVELGHLRPDDLQMALALQHENPEQKRRLGDVLVEHHFVDENQLVQVLSVQFGFPIADPEFERIDREVVARAPVKWCQQNAFVPIKREGERFHVAFADPTDEARIEAAEQVFGRGNVIPCIARRASIEAALVRLTGSGGRRDVTVDEPDAVGLVNEMLGEALQLGTSDIHIEPRPDRISIRFRVDGVLIPWRDLPISLASALAGRIKVLAKADIAERRRHQGGRFYFEKDDQRIDLRVSIYVTVNGEKIVLRLLNHDRRLLSLTDIGMSSRMLEGFKEDALLRPSGVILVTGPTGSGKTTTLYSCIAEIKNDSTSIITAEDPVEYVIDGITQCSINPSIDLTYDETLRHIVRQDPDVIVIGEIRTFSASTRDPGRPHRPQGADHLPHRGHHRRPAAPAQHGDRGLPRLLHRGERGGSAPVAEGVQRLRRALRRHARRSAPLRLHGRGVRRRHAARRAWLPELPLHRLPRAASPYSSSWCSIPPCATPSSRARPPRRSGASAGSRPAS